MADFNIESYKKDKTKFTKTIWWSIVIPMIVGVGIILLLDVLMRVSRIPIEELILNGMVLLMVVVIIVKLSQEPRLKSLLGIEYIFWKKFAERNNGTYSKQGIIPTKKSLILRHHPVLQSDFVQIKGASNLPTTFFNFSYSLPFELIHPNHSCNVITFLLKKKLPHLFLSYKKNKYKVRFKKSLPLPKEFNKNFLLFVPRQYEIEALQIFTPDVFADILDLGLYINIEFIENNIIFFIEREQSSSHIEHLEKIEALYPAIDSLAMKLFRKVEHFLFEKIGNRDHYLK